MKCARPAQKLSWFEDVSTGRFVTIIECHGEKEISYRNASQAEEEIEVEGMQVAFKEDAQ